MRILKRFTTLAALLAVILAGAPALVYAQQQGPGAAVTQTGTRGDASLRCDTILAAGGALATLTMQNPGPGLSNYVTAVGNFAFASAATMTAAVAVLPTTTGFNGTSASVGWPLASGGGPVAPLSLGAVPGGWFVPATPIKTNANAAASVNGGVAITGASNAVTVCYYPAP